jgi:hypothetical protein
MSLKRKKGRSNVPNDPSLGRKRPRRAGGTINASINAAPQQHDIAAHKLQPLPWSLSQKAAGASFFYHGNKGLSQGVVTVAPLCFSQGGQKERPSESIERPKSREETPKEGSGMVKR